MIGIILDDKEAIFLRELLYWYSNKSTFGPNSVISYKLYLDIKQNIERQE
jgi:hypothetical protein